MAVENPMVNYNRNNPYVIAAKLQYTKLMDLYHLLMKKTILFTLTCWVLMIALGVQFAMSLRSVINTTDGVFNVIVAALSIINILINCVSHTQDVHRVLTDELNVTVDKVMSAQINEIIESNDETVNQAIHQIYMLNGKVTNILSNVSGRYLYNVPILLLAICGFYFL